MNKPVGISLLSIGAKVTASAILHRISIPAACALSYFGSGLLLLLMIFSSMILFLFVYFLSCERMFSIKNVVERFGNAEHEYGAVRFLMRSIRGFLESFFC